MAIRALIFYRGNLDETKMIRMQNTLINGTFWGCLKKMADLRRCYSTHAKLPELTSVRYKIQRGFYNVISDTDVRFFDALLGSNRLLTDPDDCQSYNIDFTKTVRGVRLCHFSRGKKSNLQFFSLYNLLMQI